jgi:hypothetical protein
MRFHQWPRWCLFLFLFFQAHFSRERLSGDLANDARTAVKESARLLQVGACLYDISLYIV